MIIKRWAAKRLGIAATLAALLALLASPVWAQDYPNRAVRIIVPFPPGGPVDILARLVASELHASLKQPFVIENRAGASGNTGMAAVARSDPDGYTLLMTSSALTANPGLFMRTPYDPVNDFEPITVLGASPNVFVSYPPSGIRTMAELVARAKEKPGTINIAVTGVGTTPHLTAELLKIRAGIDILNIPYAGSGPSMQAILSGTTEIGVSALPPALPLTKAGSLIGIAVTGTERWPDLPIVPTMVELGYKDFVMETVIPFLAPANTPKPIIAILAKAAADALNRPGIRTRVQEAGFQVLGDGPEPLRARIAREVVEYKALIEQAGIKRQP